MKNLIFLFICIPFWSWGQNAEIKYSSPLSFSFIKQTDLPAPPNRVFDLATGDISAWWDHSFYPKPNRLYIEPKAGGGFYELLNEQGHGIQHARVTAAVPGKLLRMEGPLGLAGKALQLVCTYQLDSLGNDSTRFTLMVNGTGEVDQNTAEIIEKVWEHFLFERFVPYVIKKKGPSGR